MPGHITPKVKGEIMARLKAGENPREIAKELGWAYKTIQRMKNGKSERRTWTPDEEARLVDELKANTEWKAIASMLHRSQNACQVHYQEMLNRTRGTQEQAKILVPAKLGDRRTDAVLPLPTLQPVYIDQCDIYGLWCRAMDTVRKARQ